jgi:phosphatidate cytidylyltransferase
MLPLLLLVYIGGLALIVLCFAVSIAGIKEFFRAFEDQRIQPSMGVAGLSLACLYIFNIFTRIKGYGETDLNFYTLWVILAVSLSFIYMYSISKRNMEDGLSTMTGIIYVGFFPFHLVLMDRLDHGVILIWLILITAFGTDIMAYFIGRAIGKHKLCPKISPNKTVEGAIGGLIGSGVFCALFGLLLLPDLLIHCIVIGLLGGVFAQIGDLTASIFKRQLGIKDFSSLIPGHGGIMDRADSIFFTAPLVYYYCALFQL